MSRKYAVAHRFLNHWHNACQARHTYLLIATISAMSSCTREQSKLMLLDYARQHCVAIPTPGYGATDLEPPVNTSGANRITSHFHRPPVPNRDKKVIIAVPSFAFVKPKLSAISKPNESYAHQNAPVTCILRINELVYHHVTCKMNGHQEVILLCNTGLVTDQQIRCATPIVCLKHGKC
jgi:hypothetical protein